MVPSKVIPQTIKAPHNGTFCIYCASCGLSGSGIFHDYFCSSKRAKINSTNCDSKDLPPLSTTASTPNLGPEEQEDGSPIESDFRQHHHDNIENSRGLDYSDECDPQFRLRLLSTSPPHWPHHDDSGPIAYAEMNQMYERVGIKLDRSSFLFLSEVVSSSTSTPLRVFSSIDTNGYDYDESSEIEQGIISSYLRSDVNELGHANIDNDDGMTEKSLSSSSHTDNSVTNSDIHTISTRCRSQSQSSGTTASIAGDAHLTRLRQACEEHISLSHELETNLSRSLNFKLRFESSEKVNIRSEPGIPSDPKEKLMSLNSSRLQSSGSRSFFSRFIPWKKNAQVLNTSRFDNDDHGKYEDENNGNFEGNKRYGCSISPPVIGSDKEGKNILSTKLPQASSSDLKSYFHTVSRIEEKKNLTSSQDGIQSCDSTCDNTGTTSPASTVVSGALPIVDLSCNSGCSVTRQSSSNYSITGTKEGDEKLINVSIAFSEVLQLQGNASDAVVMMENLLEDLESCLTSRKSSICLQSTTTSPKEERTSKKRVQFEVTVLATGTDRDLTLTNDGSGVRSPVLCRTSADLEKQFHQHHCPHHYHENNPNGCHSTKTKKNIEEEMKIENFSCPSSGNLVEESAISSLSRSQAGNTESSNISEYMWYKRNIAVCHRRLGVLYKSAGRLIEAEGSLRNFISLRQELDYNENGIRRDIANTYCLLAAVIDQIGGRVDEAIAADKISIDLMSLIN